MREECVLRAAAPAQQVISSLICNNYSQQLEARALLFFSNHSWCERIAANEHLLTQTSLIDTDEKTPPLTFS